VSALRYFHKKMHHVERPIYIYHAILLILNAAALDYEVPLPDVASLDLNLERWRKEGADMVTMESFPDYVIDRHTTLARNQSPVVFAEVGAWIPDEDKRFLNQEHRRMYHAFKVLQEKGEVLQEKGEVSVEGDFFFNQVKGKCQAQERKVISDPNASREEEHPVPLEGPLIEGRPGERLPGGEAAVQLYLPRCNRPRGWLSS
jgi:hypothetical protein